MFTVPRSMGIFSLSSSPLSFKSSIPPRMKENRALPTLRPPAGFYLSTQTTPSLFILPAGSALGGRTSRQHHLSRGSPRADAQPSPPPTPVRPSLEPGWGSHLGTWRHCLSTSGWRKHPFKQVVELSMHRCKFPSSLASSSVFPIAEVWSE